MRIVLIVILIDLFIFTIGTIFYKKEQDTYDAKGKTYNVDRYGYLWIIDE